MTHQALRYYHRCSGVPHPCPRSAADLYVVRLVGGPPCLKVGRSSRVMSRVADIARRTPFNAEILHVWPGLGRLEWDVHHALRAHRADGPSREWFCVSLDRVKGVVDGLTAGASPDEPTLSEDS